jgi:hypothetical protein
MEGVENQNFPRPEYVHQDSVFSAYRNSISEFRMSGHLCIKQKSVLNVNSCVLKIIIDVNLVSVSNIFYI